MYGFFLLAYSYTWLEELVLLMVGLPSALLILLAPAGPELCGGYHDRPDRRLEGPDPIHPLDVPGQSQ